MSYTEVQLSRKCILFNLILKIIHYIILCKSYEPYLNLNFTLLLDFETLHIPVPAMIAFVY